MTKEKGMMGVRKIQGRAARARVGQPVDERGQDPPPDAGIAEAYIFPRESVPVDAYIRIYRRDPVSKTWVILFRMDRDEQTYENVHALSGGGKFRADRIAHDEKLGYKVITGSLPFELGGPAKLVTKLPPSMQDAAAQVVAASPGAAAAKGIEGVSVDEIMNVLKLRVLAGQQESQQSKGSSLAEILAAVAPLAQSVTKLFELAAARKEPVDVGGLVEKITAALHKSEAAQSPVAQFKDMAEAMNSLLDLKDRAGEGGEDTDPLLKMASENLPRLLDIIQGAALRRGRRVTADEARRELAPAGSAPALGDGAPAWQHFISKNRAFFLRAAAAGKRPEVQAVFAFDMLPDALRGSVRELMAAHVAEDGPNAADQIIGLVPEFAAHRAWLQDFCDTLAGQFFPEEESPAPTSEPPGEGDGV